MSTFHSEEIHKLEMYNGRSSLGGDRDIYCDLLITNNKGNFSRQIYLASIIGQEKDTKQVSWLFQESKNGRIRPADNKSEGERIRFNAHANPKKSKYDEFEQKVDEMTHMLLIDKSAQPNTKDRNDWQQEEDRRIAAGQEARRLPEDLSEFIIAWDGNIQDQIFRVLWDRYNTPMLGEEDWKEYITGRLQEEEYFQPLNVYTFGTEIPVEAGLLRLTEKQLEKIISEGVQDMEVEFSIEDNDEIEPVLQNCEGLEDYLSHFAGDLGKTIQDNVHVRFDPTRDAHSEGFNDVNAHANSKGLTGLFPPQADAVMGAARTLLEDDYSFIIGEMGVGKTVIGGVAPYITEYERCGGKPKPFRALLFVPNITVEKWKREIKERVPGAEVYEIKSWRDALALKKLPKKPKNIEYWVMNSDLPSQLYPIEPTIDERVHTDDLMQNEFDEVPHEKIRHVTRMIDKFDDQGNPVTTNIRKVNSVGETVPLIQTNDDGSPLLEPTGEEVTGIDGEGNEYTETVGVRIPTEYASDNHPWVQVQAKEMEKQMAGDFGERVRFEHERFFNAARGEHDVVVRTSPSGMHCPKCGGLLTNKKGDPADGNFFNRRPDSKGSVNYMCTNMVETKHIPKEDIKKWRFDRNKNRYVPSTPMQQCGFVLWQNERLPLDSKKRKVSPTWVINKMLPRGFFKYLIADEVHEYKSGTSKVAQGFGQLVNHTEKQILLTGTLVGGKASDIFYLLARLDSKRLLKESISYDSKNTFISRYGVQDRRIVNGRSQGGNEQAGISPNLFAPYLMKNCVFLELADLGYALPPYQEIPVEVPMAPEQKGHYDDCERQMRSSFREGIEAAGMGFVSTYINAMYQYSDMPFHTETITMQDERKRTHILARPYNYDRETFTPPKLEALVDILEEEIYQQDRKVLIYAQNTGKGARNPVDQYLFDKLTERGYKVGVLRSSGSFNGVAMPKNGKAREQWLKDRMEEHGWDVLITNPRLVKVGLDLLDFPTIVYYQMGYNTYEYMQASRRSWRIKQTQPVKIYTLVYADTIQSKVLNHMAKKIDAAMAMQGKFSEEGLRAMADSTGGGMNDLAKKLMGDGALEEVETLSSRFQRLNLSYEQMQNAEYEGYETYTQDPLGIEEVRRIAQGVREQIEEDVKNGVVSRDMLEDFISKMDDMIKQADTKKANSKQPKKKKVVEGQLELDLFA